MDLVKNFKAFEKNLDKFFRLCRKHGITVAKIDGMEFQLGAMPDKPKRTAAEPLQDPLAGASVSVSPELLQLQKDLNSDDPKKAQAAYEKLNQMQADDKIETPDALTEEQQLMYSVTNKPDSHTGEDMPQ